MLRLALAPLVALSFAAGPAVDRAVEHFKSDPVYVDSAGTLLTDAGADAIREQIRDRADRPIFVAVFEPGAVAEEGSEDATLDELYFEHRVAGTYVLAVRGEIRAKSNTLEKGRAPQLANAAMRANERGDLAGVLEHFIAGVQDAPLEDGVPERPEAEADEGEGGSILPILLLVGGGILLFTFLSGRKRKRVAAERDQALQGARQDLQAELAVLADDVLRLEPEVDVHTAARPDYDAAVARYKWLEAAIPQIDSPDDPPRIQRAMSEARYAMARAQAIVRGHEPPPPPDDLTHRGRYGEPAIEIDEEDEYRRPRYAGYGGGWQGGGFFAGNDLFTGMLLGSMLGGGGGFFGGGGGFERGYDRGYEEGVDDAGDAGGGDFDGGGDFGGGDFGGGDFG
ncbi:MAG TPA: hypothetical protein VF230_04040 [Acidimicrobiales bacterium]